MDIKCTCATIEEHLRGINGFIVDQKEENNQVDKKIDSVRKKVWMAQGGVAVVGVIATVAAYLYYLGL